MLLALLAHSSGPSPFKADRWCPSACFCFSCHPHRILGFGVSLAIKGSYADNKTSFGVGVGLAIAGFMGVVAAALGFGAAASRIDRRLVSGILGRRLPATYYIAPTDGPSSCPSCSSARLQGIAFKCFSIGGGSMIALGYALKQYFVSDDKPICRWNGRSCRFRCMPLSPLSSTLTNPRSPQSLYGCPSSLWR